VPTAAATPSPTATAPNTAAAVGGPQPAGRPAAAAPRSGNLAAGEGRTAPAAPRPHAKHRNQPGATAPQHLAPALPSIDPLAGLAIPAAGGGAVPDAIIDGFGIPPFLLPIYQAAGTQYGIPWEVLAAINEIETNYGRNVQVSSAGARGWMQFMPATWRTYGVDANRDGRADPGNPVDAIFAAGRYLQAAGAQTDLRGAILAYNHAGWYADSVLRRAQAIGGLPTELVASLTGLAQGRFPVLGASTYGGHARRGMTIVARTGARVVAVDDGQVIEHGESRSLGRFVVLRDVYGNTFTYGNLGSLRRVYHRRQIKRGTRLTSGTVLGRVGRGTGGRAPHLVFSIRPAGHGAPRIDPRPILDGWRLLEATDAYRATRERRPVGAPSVGQILLMSRGALASRVLADPRIAIYPCGREDIRAGRIDRRVLATMLFLDASGLRPTISSLECGHGYLTSSGNVSEHSLGMAMDIAAVNGIRITPAMQGPGSITDVTIRRLLTLQGALRPHQIISLMTFPGAANALAMGDHADHIHVGWGVPGGSQAVDATLRPGQWTKLSDRLGKIRNPSVRRVPVRQPAAPR
jgi:murein DD-endopeptidase MepM/ murein hydrolase activator NlpD